MARQTAQQPAPPTSGYLPQQPSGPQQSPGHAPAAEVAGKVSPTPEPPPAEDRQAHREAAAVSVAGRCGRDRRRGVPGGYEQRRSLLPAVLAAYRDRVVVLRTP